jgi:ankyrin repeat protein
MSSIKSKQAEARRELDRQLVHSVRQSDSAYLDVVSLLRRGASPNAVDASGSSVLHSAVSNGFFGLVNLLLRSGAAVNKGDSLDVAPLIYAVRKKGGINFVKLLLSHGADVNVRDAHLCTPLLLAAKCRDCDVVRALMEAGADAATTVRSVRDFMTLNIASAWSEACDSGDTGLIAVVGNGLRQKQAKRLLNWQIVMAPLELPICE